MKYTRHTKEFIEKYIDILCDFLLINNPEEIVYNQREYSRIEIGIDEEGLTISKLWIGTHFNSNIELCYELAHEIRHAYQHDVAFDDNFLANSQDDRYILDYAAKIKPDILKIKDSEMNADTLGYNFLFTEIDADGFAIAVVNTIFQHPDNQIFIPLAFRNGEDASVDERIEQANRIINNEELVEFLNSSNMKELLAKYNIEKAS